MAKMPFPKYDRPINVYRFDGVERTLAGCTTGKNLPEGMANWFARYAAGLGLFNPLFTANTVTATNEAGDEVTYVATD